MGGKIKGGINSRLFMFYPLVNAVCSLIYYKQGVNQNGFTGRYL